MQITFPADGTAETGAGIMHRVGMGIDGKIREIASFPSVLVHVAPHQHGIHGSERNAHVPFIFRIRCCCQFCRDLFSRSVCHFFCADGNGGIDVTGGYGHQCLAEG